MVHYQWLEDKLHLRKSSPLLAEKLSQQQVKFFSFRLPPRFISAYLKNSWLGSVRLHFGFATSLLHNSESGSTFCSPGNRSEMKSERYLTAASDTHEALKSSRHHDFLVEERPRFLRLAAVGKRARIKWAQHGAMGLRADRPCQRTLIVGNCETGHRLAAELRRHFPNDFLLVGMASDGPDAPDLAAHAKDRPQLPLLGTREELAQLVREHQVERVMFANCVDWQLDNTGFQVRSPIDRRTIAGRKRPDAAARGVRDRRREVSDLYTWATGASFKWPDARRARFYRCSKRSFDIAFSLLALAASLPLALIILPVIKLSSPGPVFYAQERVGRGGIPFTIYKLRTMKSDAEKDTGPTLSPHGDTRSTGIGRLLRATKLDEVPQFWNVLKGEMSIVGPRPERAHFVDPFSSHIYSYSLRHAVRPGLTGLAQIRGDHLTHVYVKLHYDLIYVCNRCFALDLAILARTPLTILRNLVRRP